MYCSNCGRKVDLDANFCPNCGAGRLKITKTNPQVESSIVGATGDNIVINNPNQIETKLARKEREAMYFGILIGTIWFIISILVKNGTIDAENNFKALFFFSLGIRIISTLWINGISRRLRRNQVTWCLFGFLIPVLALIIIGNLTYDRSTINLLKNQITIR